MTYFIIDDLLLLCVIQGWHGESTLIFWINREVDIPQMSEIRIIGVRVDICTRELFVWCDKPPSYSSENKID